MNNNIKKFPNKTKSTGIKSKPVVKKVENVKKTKKTQVANKSKIKCSKNLSKHIFDVKINKSAIFRTIIADRSSIRKGVHTAKTRAQVSGTGAKPWRQKGTGNARTGSLRTPIFRGGGVAFPPQVNKNYSLNINKKIKKLAFNSALTIKAKDNSIFVHDFKMKKPSTKNLLSLIEEIDLQKNQRKILFITDDLNIYKSARNLKYVQTTKLNSLIVEKILHNDVLIFSSKSIERLEGRK